MKLLILYEELASYFLACLKHLSERYNVEIHIIRKKINADAPFDFDIPSKFYLYEREKYSSFELLELVNNIKPDSIFCGGWSSKNYLNVCKAFNGIIPVFLGFDNWLQRRSVKQKVRIYFGRNYFQNYFRGCFVPGNRQKELAMQLGFAEDCIFTGAYCCDTDYFHQLYLNNVESKKKIFPRKFLYVGRYAAEKNIELLWQAFAELQKEEPSDWELWSLGAGSIRPIIHEKIKHFGFVQPNEIPRFVSETGVFVLPSSFEPWGVVVHEFATCGFPLLCSDMIGSAEVFLENNKNGYFFENNNKSDLKSCLRKIMSQSDEQLLEMSAASAKLGLKINLSQWADSVYKLMNMTK